MTFTIHHFDTCSLQNVPTVQRTASPHEMEAVVALTDIEFVDSTSAHVDNADTSEEINQEPQHPQQQHP